MLVPVALFASLALLQQTAPAAQTPPRQPAPAPAATPAEAAQLSTVEVTRTQPQSEIAQVCRTEPVTGSRFGRRVCRNAVETADDRRDSQEMLRRMQGSRMPDGG